MVFFTARRLIWSIFYSLPNVMSTFASIINIEQKILDDWGIRFAILCSYAWRATMITLSFTASSRHSWCKEVIRQGQEQVKWDWFVVVSCKQSHCVAVYCGKSCNQRLVVMLFFDDYHCMTCQFECEEQVGIPYMEDHLLMRYIHDCDSIIGVWLLVPMLALRTQTTVNFLSLLIAVIGSTKRTRSLGRYGIVR